MPIKPENRDRYPPDWKQIREAILERAAHCCEQCRVPNHAVIERGFYHDRGTWRHPDGSIRDEDNGGLISLTCLVEYFGHPVKIVLTVAHLDHIPENCDPSNLKALCQLHHLRYNAQHHAQNARATRRARKAIGDLFDASREAIEQVRTI